MQVSGKVHRRCRKEVIKPHRIRVVPGQTRRSHPCTSHRVTGLKPRAHCYPPSRKLYSSTTFASATTATRRPHPRHEPLRVRGRIHINIPAGAPTSTARSTLTSLISSPSASANLGLRARQGSSKRLWPRPRVAPPTPAATALLLALFLLTYPRPWPSSSTLAAHA